jgi:hypothetical protein
MAAIIPIIQVLSRNNYEEQHLVPLPNAIPYPERSPSSIRVKPSIISLTANNLTYGRVGHLLGIWDIYPLPPSIPPEYASSEHFGRVGAWGYATVIESNVPEIEAFSQVFGLFPIGTLPLDMEIQVNPHNPKQFFEISKQRESVMAIYNLYFLYPPVTQRTLPQQSQGFDALFQTFFRTSYLINRFIFPWSPAELVHPRNAEDGWTIQKGSIDEKTTVLVFADSGKTALSFAYLLKNCRPAEGTPQMVVGVGSNASRNFVKETRLYDKLLTYDSDAGDVALELGLNSDSKVVLCEFGSRGEAATRWAAKLRQSHGHVVQLIVAGETILDSPEKATEKFLARSKSGAVVFNASDAGVQAAAVLGERRYFEEFFEEWQFFKERGLIEGLHLVWGKGIEDVGKGWEALCRGSVGANHGLVFLLD